MSTNSTIGTKVWCWKETDGQMHKHKSDTIYGDPADCWIKYDSPISSKLEKAFQDNKMGDCSPSSGYTINFVTMKQTKTATGYQRDVKRVDESSSQGNVLAWTPKDGTAPDGSPAFIEATRTGNYRFKLNYIFGSKAGKVGYFHITTKEAYEVLAVRVRTKMGTLGCTVGCLHCLSCLISAEFMRKEEEKLEGLKDLYDVVVARKGATYRQGLRDLPDHIRSDQNKRCQHVKDDGTWLFPMFYYEGD